MLHVTLNYILKFKFYTYTEWDRYVTYEELFVKRLLMHAHEHLYLPNDMTRYDNMLNYLLPNIQCFSIIGYFDNT